MKDDKVQVTVKVLDEVYTIRGDEDSQYIFQLAEMVDERMRDVRQQDPYLTHGQVAVLGALNIADQYMKLKRDYEELMELLTNTDNSSERLF